MKYIFLIILGISFATPLYSQGVEPNQPEQPEIGANDPPKDDSHKFFITVILDNSQESQKLHYDLLNAKELKMWVNEDHEQSFTHFNIFYANDKLQSWRWKNIQFKGYPTILIQPPLNRKFGDPAIVITQITGYTGAKKLSNTMKDWIVRYTSKF
jgi:hypothetical protein